MKPKIGAIFLWVCVSFSNVLIATHTVSICKLHDQFGGQLFYTAMVLGVAWENNLTPLFSKEVFINSPNGEFNYTNFFSRFIENDSPSQVDPSPVSHLSHHSNHPFRYTGGNICLCDVQTEYWYFERYRDEIRQLFGSPSPQILEKLTNKYIGLIDFSKTVAVHIRAYHPVLCPSHIYLGDQYYKSAMDKFPDDQLFIVFSDRITWCKSRFANYKKNMIFVEGNDHLTDFFLMTLCQHIIAANSTFSWWAAYLKKEISGRVLVPSIWFWEEYLQNHSSILARGLYPKEWEIVPVTYIPQRDRNLLNYPSTSITEK